MGPRVPFAPALLGLHIIVLSATVLCLFVCFFFFFIFWKSNPIKLLKKSSSFEFDEVEVHKDEKKKERGQYPAILTEQAWSIKNLFYGIKQQKMIFDLAILAGPRE